MTADRPYQKAVAGFARFEMTFDRRWRHEYLSGDRLLALAKIAGGYRVARNFRRRYDVEPGLVRYAPVADV